ncbi:hypothetical protein DKT77_17820 [Meridianimarinicoccus roseus]|uniref:Uncharacterized protein n=1 Tax=Meridianimarinicoccus roseus TaxID=2072018 RepID=A0A2V2L767_9RHOB|nr:hypothetical protein [Meridianimarinicoccus roseus]PWR01288.1 hypothetical protein DKT77_17820 [Meridianimarinicoccus roseus]
MSYDRNDAFKASPTVEGAARKGMRDGARARNLDASIAQQGTDYIDIALAAYRRERARRALGRGARTEAEQPTHVGSTDLPGKMPRKARSSSRMRPLRLVTGVLVIALAASGAALTFAPATTDRLATNAVRAMSAPEDAFSEGEALCSSLVEVRDEAGRRLGYQTSECASRRGLAVAPINSEDAVTKIASAMEPLEGRTLGQWTLTGIDLRGPARAMVNVPSYLVDRILRPVGMSPFDAPVHLIGGSPPLVSGLEMVTGHTEGSGKTSLQNIPKKLGSYARTAIFTAHNLPDKASRDRFVAESFACVAGQRYTDARFGPALGGEFCAVLLGRESLEELTLPEACFIAATARRPALAPGRRFDEKAREERDSRHAYLQGRAKMCLARLAEARGYSDETLNGFLARVDAIRPLEPAAGRGTAMRVGNLGGAFAGIAQDSGGAAQAVTLAAASQAAARALADEVEKTLASAAEKAKLCFGATCPADRRIEVLLALGEIGDDGGFRVRGLSESRQGLLFGPGLPSARPSAGSTNKAALLPLLALHGIETACAAPFRGLQNYDGFKGAACREPADEVDLETATAVSDNLVFIDAARRLPPTDIVSYLEAAGYAVFSAEDERLDIAGIVLGYGATPTPAGLMRVAASIQSGRPVGPLQISTQPRSERLSVAELTSPDAVAKARRDLEAPLRHAHGTARHAPPILDRAECTSGIAKTGTVDSVTPPDGVSAKLAVMAATCSGRSLVAIVRIAGPDGVAIQGVSSRLTTTIAARLIAGATAP